MTEQPKARHFTNSDWINKRGPALSDWPQRKKKSGDISRVKSGQTAKVKAMLKRLGL